jgi:hypothetical protein
MEFADLRKKAHRERGFSLSDVAADAVEWHHPWTGENRARRLTELCSFLQVSFGNSENNANVTASAGNFGSLIRTTLPTFLNSKV